MRVTEEEMKLYRATAQRRWAKERQQLTERHQRAWMLTSRAAALLKEQFGVRKVVVFGSLVREDLFHPQSDVDLAVWGLDERRYYRLVAQLLALDPGIKIDLVMIEDAPITLRTRIEHEGVVV